MGSCFSCRSSPKLQNIRVVHLSGYVEDYAYPVSVSQVITGTGKPSKHFVCTAAQLLSAGSKPLQLETQLEAGRIYFLLPSSALEDDISPSDFSAVVKKLTAIAKSTRCSRANSSSRTSPLLLSQHGSPSPTRNSPSRSPGRPCGGRTWKPLLDPIREKSFNRSESGLQEMP
ncbi:hypothetical protein Tsubulata_038792 [Turnera subulata]|uniref:Uncharacterized protein n=1 Tax=Turnera subulata TaxID=218843 RepID=A0A9Q0FNX3_9ROSI|nr:hypothetical protein Tsubulata_038792 [Turnera subulata]